MDVLLSISALILCLGLVGLLVYETYALDTHKKPPITDIIRGNIFEHTHEAVAYAGLIGMLVGWLMGHLGR